jgi:hypothetical protein
VPGILRSFYDFHTSEEKGWGDIAYNFLIDSAGGVWEGRSGSLLGPVAGDATGGNQGFSQLVCVIGDFNVVTPTKESMTALVALLAWLSNRHGLDTAPGATVDFTSRGSNLWAVGALVTTPTITGHRTMSRTTCPGSNLNDYVTGPLMADVTTAREQARISAAPVVAVEGPVSTTTSSLSDLVPPTTSTTSTTIPATPPPTRSPLVLVAAGLATFATLLVIWRARRMGDD